MATQSPSGKRICPACQKTRLSRYNADPLCAACARSAGTTGGLVPAWLWDSAPMRDALARTDMGAVVAILRSAAGLSQLDLANLVDGWSQTTVSRFEAGQRQSIYDIREILRFADLVDMPREALLPLIFGRADATMGEGDVVLAMTGADVERRTFNSISAGLMIGTVLPSIQGPSRVDDAHIRYLRAALDRVRTRDQAVGGGVLLHQAVRQFARAKAMLDEGNYTERVGHQLIEVAADLGIAAGWIAYDCGDQRLARELYRETELLAACTNSSELLVHVYANMAMQSIHLARMSDCGASAREGLRFANRAAVAAKHEPSPRVHALVALRQAAAHAEIGDDVAFRGAIKQARLELDRGSHPADPPWTRFVVEDEITGHEAMGYVRLDSPARAVMLYRNVLDGRQVAPRNRAYYQSRLADALLAAGDRSQAIDEGRAVLPALESGQLTSIRTLNELRPLRAAAEQDFAEEFVIRFDKAAQALAAH